MKLTNLNKKAKYDFKKIFSEYKKLGIPKEYWTPINCDMSILWHVLISLRKSGKTTNIILLGLIMNKIYGTMIGYCRQTANQIVPKNCYTLFEVIKKEGYINKITDKKYNDVYIYANRVYYCNYDNKGKVVEKSEPIMYLLSVDNSELYKSALNLPNCDLIIFDEFVSNSYNKNEFVKFCDIYDTIARYRPECWVFMLANTLNPYNMYFQELAISKKIRELNWGDCRTYTSGSVAIEVELIKPNDYQKSDNKKGKLNSLRFGFNNPNLASITGQAVWNIKHYPHYAVPINNFSLLHRAVVEIDGDYIKIEIRNCKEIGLHAYIKPTTQFKDDCIVYTCGNVLSKRYRKWFGYDKRDNELWKIISEGRVFYATNEVGLMLDNYIVMCGNKTHIV